jgi:hypothetical protein
LRDPKISHRKWEEAGEKEKAFVNGDVKQQVLIIG